jgi:DNA repair photolyase
LEKAVNIRKDMGTTNNRKRQPEDRESVERVGYHTRKRLLRVTKFLVSGTTVTFHVNPLLESVKDEEEEYDVLVMEKFQRTYKLLVSIMKGIPVVKKNWLTDSEYRKKAAEF